MTTAQGSDLDGGQIEPTEPVWIRQDIHLNDLAARNREADHGKQAPEVTASTIAMLNDTCGNLIQLTQLARY